MAPFFGWGAICLSQAWEVSRVWLPLALPLILMDVTQRAMETSRLSGLCSCGQHCAEFYSKIQGHKLLKIGLKAARLIKGNLLTWETHWHPPLDPGFPICAC